MAWENRNGKAYYYRKMRRGHSVTSQYIGAGLLAELTAEDDEMERSRREDEQRQRADTRALDAQIDGIGELARQLSKALLLLSGYHPHKGQWRRRRK